MTDGPYRPPSVLLNDPVVRGNAFWLLAVAVALPACVSIGALLVVPEFIALFDGFDASLPLGTKVLLATYKWWGIVVLTVITMWWHRQRTSQSQVATLMFSIVCSVALSLYGFWACYAPIFALAAVTEVSGSN